MPQDLRAQLTALTVEARRLVVDSAEGLTRLAPLLEALPVAALVADDEGRYVTGNSAAVVLTGYDALSLRQLSLRDLTPHLNEGDAEVLWHTFLARQEQDGDFALLMNGGRIVRVAYAARANVLPGLHVSLLRPLER